MKEGKVNVKNFKETVNNALGNTFNFENCSVFKKYNYEDNLNNIEQILNLCDADNYVINTIIPYLKNTSDVKIYTTEQAASYEGKPMSFSKDEYGVIDYWWIILALNGYICPQDFKDFEQLIVPKKSELTSIFDKEDFANEFMGKIPE